MRNRASSTVVLVVTALTGLAAGRATPAESVTISMENPTVTATTAVFKVDLAFQGGSADLLNAIQLSVVGSDPTLTKGGTDYSRFSFQLNTTAVPGWSELAPINPTTGFD